jgi:EAL domain-containing protein (putative c-di-GMP-specific phosphodiesterase class I)
VLARIRSLLEEAGDGTLTMVFQPLSRLDSGQVVGYEARARFPGQPGLPPNVWFADAHEVGLGIELELFAGRQALRAPDRLQAPLYMSSTCHRPRSLRRPSWRPSSRSPIGSWWR